MDAAAAVIRKLVRENSELVLACNRLLKQHLGQTSERISEEELRRFLSLAGLSEAAARDLLGTRAPDSLPQRAVGLGAFFGSSPVALVAVALGAGHRNLIRPDRRRRKRKGPKPHGRKPLPANLPRFEQFLEPAAIEKVCPDCGRAKTCAGHTSTEELEFVPAHFRVIVYNRPVFECRPCDSERTQAPPPARVIEKGRPGPRLVADILINKFRFHLPLHRIRHMYLLSGVEISVSTLADWVRRAHELLAPVATRLRALALDSYVLQVDDTRVKVLDPFAPRGARNGRLWIYLGDARYVAYVYTKTWEASGMMDILRDRKGWVCADAYKGFDQLFKLKLAFEVACWAHTRRKFFDALEGGHYEAAPVVALIAKLYEIEDRANSMTVAERLALRQNESKPILEQISSVVAAAGTVANPKSPMGKAVGYVINQWSALQRFVEDGALPIDNTACEREARPIAVGRRNYLFVGADSGGERAATIYTILGTCRLQGIDAATYLTDVLPKLGREPSPSQIEALLPHNWKAAQARPP